MAREFKSAPEHLQGIIREAAESNGLTYEELERQLWIESNYDPKAQGPALRGGVRAQGIAQFVPATAKEWGVDVNDVTSSINGAAKYMRWLVDQFDGDKNAARAAYNWGIGKVKQYGMDNLPAETQQYLKYFEGLDSGTPGTVADRSNAGATADATAGTVAGFRERQPKSEHGYGIWDLGTGGTGMGDAAKANPFEIGDRTALQTEGFNLTTQTGSVFEDQAHYGTSWIENVQEGLKGTYAARAVNWAQGKLDDDGWRPGNEDIAKLVREGYGDQVPFISNANGSEDYKRRIKQVDDQREMARLQTFESPVGVFLQTTAGSMGDPLGVVFGAGVGAAFRMRAIAAAVAATKTATPAARAAAIEAAAHGSFGRMLAEGAITDFAAESGFQALESGQIDWHSVAVEVLMGQGLAATTAGVAIGAAGVRHAMAPWMNDADLTARELAQQAAQLNKELALLEPTALNIPLGPVLLPENIQVVTPRTVDTETVVTPWASLRHRWDTAPGAYDALISSITSASPAPESGVGFSLESAQAVIDRNTKRVPTQQDLDLRAAEAADAEIPKAKERAQAAAAAVADVEARLKALRGDQNKLPRKGSKKRAEYDDLAGQLEALMEDARFAEESVAEAEGWAIKTRLDYTRKYAQGPEPSMLTLPAGTHLSGEAGSIWDNTQNAWEMMQNKPGQSFEFTIPATLTEPAEKHIVVAYNVRDLLTGVEARTTELIAELQDTLPGLYGEDLTDAKDQLTSAKLVSVWSALLGKRLRGQELLGMFTSDRQHRAHAWTRYGGGWLMSARDSMLGLFGKTTYSADEVGRGMTDYGKHVLIHETMHSLTSSTLYVYDRNPNRLDPETQAACAEIYKLLDDYRAELTNRGISWKGDPKTPAGYAGKDAHEFIAQIFTDRAPIEILNSMPSKRGFASRLMDLAAEVLRILGFSPKMTAYNDAVAAVEVLLKSPAKLEMTNWDTGTAAVRQYAPSNLSEAQGKADATKTKAPERTAHGGQKITGRTKEFMDSADNFRDNVETRPEVKKIRERINAYYEKFRGKLPKGFVNGWAKYMDTVGMNLARSENHYARWVGSWLTEVGVGVGRNGSTAAMRFNRTLLDYRQKYVAQLNEYLGTFLFGDYETKSFSAIQSGIYDQKKTQEFWQRVQTYRLQRRHDMLAEREHVPQEADRSVLAAADAMDRAASEMAEILKGANLPEGADILTGTKAGATGYIRYQFEAELLRQLPPAKQRAVADQLVEQYFKKYVARDESLKALQEDPEGFTLVAHDKMQQRLEKLLEDAQAAEDAGDTQGATARRNLASGLRKQIQEIETNPEAFVAAQFAQIEKAARAMAEDHGRGYFERIIQNHEVRADGTTAWAQELGKRILAQDFAGQEITPEIAQIWKERLQEQMQDRTRMELDLLTEFGEGQKLMDYIQLNGNAMISSQGRAAAGRSALANFGITTDADADAVLDGATQAGCSDDEIRSMKKMLDLYLGRLDSDPETEALASFMSNMAYVMMMSKQSVQLLSDIGNAVQWAGMPAAVRLAAQALGNIVSLKAFKRTYDPKTLETAEGQLYAFFPGSVGEQFNAFMPNVEKIIGDVQPDQGVATRVAANMRNVAGHAFGSMLVSREVQLGLLKVAVQEVSASIITGKNWTPERMSVAGLTPEIVTRIKEQFEKHAPELVATGGREGKANWHLWDDNEALQLYQDAVVRVKGYMTLEENPGESQAWAIASPLARIILQFRGAGMRSAEKLAAAEFGIQGAAAGQVLGMQMLWAGALYTLRSLMAAAVLGEDEAEKYLEERQKPSDINFQAWLNLIPMSGIASDVVGVAGVFFGQGGVAGVVAPAGPEALDKALGLPGKLLDVDLKSGTVKMGTLSASDVPVLNSPFLLGPAMQAINAAK